MPRARRSIAPGSRGNVGPLWIFYRIVFLQLIFYTCSAALIIFTALVSGKPPSFELVFDWRTLRGDVTAGWMYGLVWMLTSLIW